MQLRLNLLVEMSSTRGWLFVVSIFCCAVLIQCSPAPKNKPHVLSKRHSLMSYYWNPHLTTGFFIKKVSATGSAPGSSKFLGSGSGSGHGSGSGLGDAARKDRIHKHASGPNDVGNHGSGSGSGSGTMLHSFLHRTGAHKAPKSIVACHGTKVSIKCPRKQTIKIRSAFWGRGGRAKCAVKGAKHVSSDHKVCPQQEANTIARLETKCKGKSTCEVASSRVVTPKCQDASKYLRVTYSCAS